jgi:hypothetical protein
VRRAKLAEAGASILLFPRCRCETAMLQEGVSDHRHERMTMKALSMSHRKTDLGIPCRSKSAKAVLDFELTRA